MKKDSHSYVKECVDCGYETKVTDTRERSDGAILRRRKCVNCGYHFRTIEIEDCMSDYSELSDEIDSLKKEIVRLKEIMRTARRSLEI